MPFKHDHLPWGDWLRGVKAAEQTNRLVVGQDFEENLRAVVQVDDLSPFAAARGGGAPLVAAGGAGTFHLVELVAVRACVVEKIIPDLGATATHELQTFPVGTVPLLPQLPATPLGSLPYPG